MAILNIHVTSLAMFLFRYKCQQIPGVEVKPAKYIVDKQTLHGNYFRLYNDFLGTKKMQIWPSFANGYYINNMEPAQLKETLEKELARKDLPNDVRKRIQTLVKSLDEGGNNVVLFAKMKDK